MTSVCYLTVCSGTPCHTTLVWSETTPK